MTVPPPRQRLERPDTPEVAALRRLRAAQPQLAGAVDMQIEIVALYRRAQTRVTTRLFDVGADALAARLESGTPIVRFADVPFDWPELRGMFRQIIDLLRRFDLVESSEYDAMQALVRSGRPNPVEVAAWYNTRSSQIGGAPPDSSAAGGTQAQVLSVASRPFLSRAVEMIHDRVDLTAWTRPVLPVLWRRTGTGRYRYDRRAPADLWKMCRAVAIRPVRMSLLRCSQSRPLNFIRDCVLARPLS